MEALLCDHWEAKVSGSLVERFGLPRILQLQIYIQEAACAAAKAVEAFEV